MKRYLLIISLLISSISIQALETGKCGDNATWTLEDSVFTVSGTGPMFNYNGVSVDVPGRDIMLILKKLLLQRV